MDINIDVNNVELLAACGIYCGACPQYLRNPKKCGGCFSNKGFSKTERRICGVLKCVKKQKLNRCNECSIFPTHNIILDKSGPAIGMSLSCPSYARGVMKV